MSIKIFISYRPEDTGDVARRLHDRLGEAFGSDNVLKKTQSTEAEILASLPEKVAMRLARRVSQCSALVAVIGPDWLSARDAAGVPRIGCRNDLVTVAIAAAAARNLRIVPVLVDGASMPPVEALPDDLLSLAWREAFVLRDLEKDVDRLVEILRGDATTGRQALSLPRLVLPRPSFPGRSFRGLSFAERSLRRVPLPSLRGLSFPRLSFPRLSFQGLSFPGLSFRGLSLPALQPRHLNPRSLATFAAEAMAGTVRELAAINSAMAPIAVRFIRNSPQKFSQLSAELRQ